jgi:hypothetical protein
MSCNCIVYVNKSLVFVLLNSIVVQLESFKILVNYLFVWGKVDNKSNGQVIENILMTRFTSSMHLLE